LLLPAEQAAADFRLYLLQVMPEERSLSLRETYFLLRLAEQAAQHPMLPADKEQTEHKFLKNYCIFTEEQEEVLED
jgi:hypothetical protein